MTTPDLHTPASVDQLDAYLDAAPRPDCDAVHVGPFTLFVSRSPWPYYARPTPGDRTPVTTADLEALTAACAEHGVRPTIEWVHEVRPELAPLATAFGLDVSSHALMQAPAADVVSDRPVDGATLRVLAADDPALAAARATADTAFTAGGTGTGPEGPAERDAFLRDQAPELTAHLHDRAARGLTVTAVAETPSDGVVAVGSYQPMGTSAEIVGVATLPTARRRGLAGAVTALLAHHAHTAGVHTVLLSAQNDAVAAVYARLGFHRAGTTHAAERSS